MIQIYSSQLKFEHANYLQDQLISSVIVALFSLNLFWTEEKVN